MRPRHDTDWLAVSVEMCRGTVIADGKGKVKRDRSIVLLVHSDNLGTANS
jgi:hypothetical protein